jgi:GTP pyrophosphokinase
MPGTIQSLENAARAYLPQSDIERIHAAYVFAEKAHGPQKRASGEPYITHPVSTAITLAKMR